MVLVTALKKDGNKIKQECYTKGGLGYVLNHLSRCTGIVKVSLRGTI